MPEKLTEVKLAELASTFGAGVLGFGLGALLADYFQQYALLIILLGLMMHGWGMYKTHLQSKKEGDHKDSNPQIKPGGFSWKNLLYLLCWVIIIGLAIYVLVKLL
ncbi:MAG: hypothetical protein FIB08_17695 [Candidatus Methanoperedens sp.]|nr:hypothetical protein [Candidatus Methanoperedens sp.]